MVKFFNHGDELFFFKELAQFPCHSFEVIEGDFAFAFLIKKAKSLQNLLNGISLRILPPHNVHIVVKSNSATFLHIILSG